MGIKFHRNVSTFCQAFRVKKKLTCWEDWLLVVGFDLGLIWAWNYLS
jgi:hypothetical protein